MVPKSDCASASAGVQNIVNAIRIAAAVGPYELPRLIRHSVEITRLSESLCMFYLLLALRPPSGLFVG